MTNLETEIAETSALVSKYEAMMFFFLKDRTAKFVLPTDFPQSNPAGIFIAQLMEECDEDGIDVFVSGIERSFALEELALLQRKFIKLTEAKEKIQRALQLKCPGT